MKDEKIESVTITDETENTKKENEANAAKARKPRSDKGKPHNWKNKVSTDDTVETVNATEVIDKSKIKHPEENKSYGIYIASLILIFGILLGVIYYAKKMDGESIG